MNRAGSNDHTMKITRPKSVRQSRKRQAKKDRAREISEKACKGFSQNCLPMRCNLILLHRRFSDPR
jgi:hypothetical protein